MKKNPNSVLSNSSKANNSSGFSFVKSNTDEQSIEGLFDENDKEYSTVYFHSYAAYNQKFIVPSKYKLLKVLGKGSYGVVCKAINKENNEELAIK